jgi:hypothetical protein
MSKPNNPQFNTAREAKAQAKAEKAYRKAQRPWYKKKRFIVPLVLVAVFIVIGIAGGSGGETPPAAQKPAGPPAFPGATEKDVVAKAGEAVNADGLTVTTAPLRAGDKTFGNGLCTAVKYTNGKNEPVSFNGGFDWKLQDPNGAIVMTGLFGSNKMLSAGQIAPGGQATGDVCFDARQGTPPGQYVVLYDPSFRFSSDRIAWLNQK